MKVYFHHLIRYLDSTIPKWRRTHVILIDNAPYHRSAETMALLEELQVPICFTGPHSYDAGKFFDFHINALFLIAPCELLFAHFKAEDINPRKVKTGKS